MAINPVSNNQKGFTFAGESSKTYGVYITDGAFYDAPDRDGEMIEIPGRNGAYFLDNGRFKNIEVTYRAAMGASNEADFRDGMAAVRAWLCSNNGYQRLEDEFNPDEYRLAVFKDGTEIMNVDQKTGTFDIVFDCKPQRFLKSGETAVSVSNEDILTNPTLFESHPLIACQISDAGTLIVGDTTIVFSPAPIGALTLLNSYQLQMINSAERVISKSFLSTAYKSGDTITIAKGVTITAESTYPGVEGSGTMIVSGDGRPSITRNVTYDRFAFTITTHNAMTFTAGTASTRTITGTAQVPYKTDPASAIMFATMTVTLSLEYDGANTILTRLTMPEIQDAIGRNAQAQTATVTVNSSKSSFEGDVYIDTEIGEAYTRSGETIASVNDFVYFGADLPTLQSGATSITYDDTISNVSITPRWWEV